MKTLLIDDKREIQVTRVARTFHEGIQALMEGGWDVLYLDHDLADFTGSDLVRRPENKKEWTGYDVLCWLEEFPQYLPARIDIVSSNPVGVERMRQVIKKLYQR